MKLFSSLYLKHSTLNNTSKVLNRLTANP